MTKDDPYYDKYKANIEGERRLLQEKFGHHAPPRSMDPKRPSDEELHRQAFERMAAQPQGNPNPRRADKLELHIVSKVDRNGGPS